MDRIPEEGKIIGYVNTSHVTPFPIVTIYKTQDKFYTRWPSGTSNLIIDMHDSSKFTEKGYYKEYQNKKIEIDQYSFMLTPNTILTGSPDYIKSKLEQAVQSKNNPISKEKIQKKDIELIEEFLKNIEKQ